MPEEGALKERRLEYGANQTGVRDFKETKIYFSCTLKFHKNFCPLWGQSIASIPIHKFSYRKMERSKRSKH